MFEDYSVRAQQVLFLARLKAGQRGANVIEVEDLTVALIIEDQGGFLKALSGLPAFRNAAAQPAPWPHQPFLPPCLANDLLDRVEALSPRSQPVSPNSDLPVSVRANHAFTAARALRGELQQSKIEPLHLLAAIVGDESAGAAQILGEAGVTREKVVKAIREQATAVSQGRPVMERTGIAVGSVVYSKRARAVRFLARTQARTRGSGTIAIEDLLVALLTEDQGGFMDAISAAPGVGIDMAHVPPPHRPFLPRDLASDLLARLEPLCSRSQPLPPGTQVPIMSEGVKRAFTVADLLRDALQQDAIEPLHLLAAIVATEPGRSTQMFLDAGITREEIVKALRGE